MTTGFKGPEIGAWGLFRTNAAIAGFGTTVFPICLGKSYVTDNTNGIFTGWGATEKSGIIPARYINICM